MSNDIKINEHKQILGLKTNTIITALFGVVVSGIGVINHMQTEAAHSDTLTAVKDLKLEITTTYIPKADYQAEIMSLTQTDSKLWEKESGTADALNKAVGEINLKLQHIEDSLPTK